jgi:hypothetical protein
MAYGAMPPEIRCGRPGCTAPPLMPAWGWPPPGSYLISELRCARHLRSQERWQSLAGDIGSGIAAAFGIGLLVIGYVLVAITGRNYGPCQGVVAATINPSMCEYSSAAHWGGLIALVSGGLVLLASVASMFRR